MDLSTVEFFENLKQDFTKSTKELMRNNSNLRGAAAFLSPQITVDELKKFKKQVEELTVQVDRFVDNVDDCIFEQIDKLLRENKDMHADIESLEVEIKNLNEKLENSKKQNNSNAENESDTDDDDSCIIIECTTQSLSSSRRKQEKLENKYSVLAEKLKTILKENRISMRLFAKHVLKEDHSKIINMLYRSTTDGYKGKYKRTWSAIAQWLSEPNNVKELKRTTRKTKKSKKIKKILTS